MALPTKIRTYTHSVNNRITYVSLLDTMGRYLYGVKNFLVATLGYVVKYSCDGTTGPSSSSDHTDRWASSANVATRGAGTGNAQSFVVLTDGNGCDLLITFQGASDDVARVAYSPSGVYLPAGTANQQPTATDEVTIVATTSLIASSTSADRVWHICGTADKKAFRVFIARSNIMVGAAWGLETITSACVSPAVLSPAVAGHSSTTFTPATFIGAGVQSTHAAVARAVVSSVGVNLLAGFGIEGIASATMLDGVNCELQGSNGALVFPLGLWTTTSGGQGKLGNMIDAYKSGNSKSDGDVSSDKAWIHLTAQSSASAGVIWPWDGTSTPQMA